MASCSPVEAPDGTAARPKAPEARVTSTSTVGLPRESMISRAVMEAMEVFMVGRWKWEGPSEARQASGERRKWTPPRPQNGWRVLLSLRSRRETDPKDLGREPSGIWEAKPRSVARDAT